LLATTNAMRLNSLPRLRQRGIIVRHFKQPRIEQHLRITIGNDAQCELLLEALREILA
jgi:histidinol-phosphate aminotransferase